MRKAMATVNVSDTGLSPDLLCIYPHGDHVILGGRRRGRDRFPLP